MTRIYIIGIGGTGLSAIARVLLEMGHTVSGSDRLESTYTRDLQAVGATIHIGHHPENVHNADLVVRSSAIPDDNPEVVAARALRIPVLKRADILSILMDGKTGIAVAGTHGKTTTTSMIAWMLSNLGKDPSFIAGSVLTNLGTNARAGKGNVFVIEADEYDRMFLGLKPEIEVVTNIEYDHPDCYPSPSDFQAAFVEFMYRLPADGTLVAFAGDAGAHDLIDKAKKLGRAVVAYGVNQVPPTGEPLDAFADTLESNGKGGFSFNASIFGIVEKVELQVPGKHNVCNALAALTVTQLLSIPLKDATGALAQFTGTKRRFEVRGETNGIIIIDDYAHHPTEIRATLAAARARYPSHRIWVVWQPHTYSRTQALFNEFSRAFNDADEIIVTEIYASRERKEGYSSKQVVETMPGNVRFIAGLSEARDYLLANLRPGDALLVLSAGDADQISTEVLSRLEESRNG